MCFDEVEKKDNLQARMPSCKIIRTFITNDYSYIFIDNQGNAYNKISDIPVTDHKKTVIVGSPQGHPGTRGPIGNPGLIGNVGGVGFPYGFLSLEDEEYNSSFHRRIEIFFRKLFK